MYTPMGYAGFRGFGDMNTDCAGPCLCPAQQALYNQATRLYPRGSDDPNWAVYIMTRGAGFGGNWADWCAAKGTGGGVILGGGAAAAAATPPAYQYQPPVTAGVTAPPPSGGMMSSPWIWVGAAVLIGGGLALVMRKKKTTAAG